MSLFFWFNHSLGARAEICQIFRGVKKRHSEIIWPLKMSKLMLNWPVTTIPCISKAKRVLSMGHICWDLCPQSWVQNVLVLELKFLSWRQSLSNRVWLEQKLKSRSICQRNERYLRQPIKWAMCNLRTQCLCKAQPDCF